MCSVQGCQKPAKSLGMCSRHYEQVRLHGATHDRPRGPSRVPAHVRVLDQTLKGECWVYQGAANTRRPTVTVSKGVAITVYKAVYEALVGPVPEGQDLHHSCGNPRCVNPDHLELMDHAEHTRRHNRHNDLHGG